MTTRIIKAFEKEVNLTDEGLALLTEKKKGLVIDIKTKEGMTLARKERTERNKLIDQVKRVAIDTKSAIDARRGSITDQITDIFAPIVTPFEIEDLRLKEEKKRLAIIEEERIKSIKTEINEIRAFALNLMGKNSQLISDIIEAVDMIDVNEVFAEFTQEALQVKKETLTELNLHLSSVMQKEALAEEQAELDAEKKKLAEEKAEFEAWKKGQQKEVEKTIDKKPIQQKTTGGYTTIEKRTPHQQMMLDVDFWAGEYGIIGTSLNDLNNILEKYK